MKVIFLGPKGTYSHQAAIQEFGHFEDAELIPSSSIPECFDRLETDEDINYSVVPLENSTNGQVVFSYDLFRDRMLHAEKKTAGSSCSLPSIQVVGEQYVSIAHCLVSLLDISLESLSNYEIVKLYSHPQVWGQVAEYLDALQKKFPNVSFTRSDSSSTSDAVSTAIALQNNEPDQSKVLYLAISSEAAASINNANPIDKKINDKKGNTTRFLVLKRSADAHAPSLIIPNEEDEISKHTRVSFITFTINDNPGALVNILSVLKDHSLNMCSIASRPFTTNEISSRKWQYVFFVEFYNNSTNTDWDAFYREIDPQCLTWTLWGTFPRNERYYS